MIPPCGWSRLPCPLKQQSNVPAQPVGVVLAPRGGSSTLDQRPCSVPRVPSVWGAGYGGCRTAKGISSLDCDTHSAFQRGVAHTGADVSCACAGQLAVKQLQLKEPAQLGELAGVSPSTRLAHLLTATCRLLQTCHRLEKHTSRRRSRTAMVLWLGHTLINTCACAAAGWVCEQVWMERIADVPVGGMLFLPGGWTDGACPRRSGTPTFFTC